MAVSPTGGGTTNPAVGVHSYITGTVVTATAAANMGYVFSAWSGACAGSGSCVVTMNANKAVTATFAAVPTFDLTVAVSPTGGGTTDPSVGVHTYVTGTVVPVTATANTGYTFSAWSGACTGSGSCSVTMNASKAVTATFTAQSVASAATPSSATATVGQHITATINIDMSGSSSPNDLLGSFTGSLDWDPAILTYSSNSGLLGGFTGAVNTANVASGHIAFNGANATGATGNVVVFQITLNAVGAGTSALNLEYTAMSAAYSFTDLRPILTITDGQVVVSSGTLGGVNGDGLVNSTDALIILSADVGMNTSAFCPMNCGDVNGDGAVNSTDALIILSYDVGMSVPFPLGTGACPSSVTQPPGCTP
jgi:Fe-S cluster biogenesis protein NfuA